MVITSLRDNQVFVFGSNLAGSHAGGAARYGLEHFGAQMGIGEGMTGQCYAFPTLGENFEQRTRDDLEHSVEALYRTAIANPEKEFLLTKVGCGIAGYDEAFMRSLFVNTPENLILPEDWRGEPHQ